MKLVTVAALTIAFLASVSAKFNLGSCPVNLATKTFTHYNDGGTGFPANTYYHHEIIAIDKQLKDLLDSVGKSGFKLPMDLRCQDLGTVPPFSNVAKAVKNADK
jgi:hypothetical protein